MSLTQHVTDPSSPVRAFFAEHFADTQALKFADAPADPALAATSVAGAMVIEQQLMLPTAAPQVLPADEVGFPWSLAGIALDYRLRMELDVLDLETTAAARGWSDLLRRPFGEREPDSGWAEVVAAVTRLTTEDGGGRVRRTPRQELELARLCAVLGMYEQLYRMGGALGQAMWDTPIARAGLNAPLDVLRGLVDDRVAEDVASMAGLFAVAAPQLVGAGPVVSNPVFARARDLRGADGDVIVGDRLVEVKAIKVAKITRAYAWQLLGYLLADTDDLYGIGQVGWYFARHGLVWSYPVAEFLQRLAGHEVDLADARAQFAAVCTTLRRPSASPEREGPVPVPSAPATAGPAANAVVPAWAGKVRRAGDGWAIVPAQVEWLMQFSPPVRGSGRWHAPLSQVPWELAGHRELDPAAPACGARVELDPAAATLTQPVGQERQEGDPRLCRRCLLYTEAFFAAPYDREAPAALADLPYLPPAAGTGKWHVRAASTGFWFDVNRPDRPACGAGVDLDLTAAPLSIPASGVAQDADPRLCRRCLGTPRHLPRHGGLGLEASADGGASVS